MTRVSDARRAAEIERERFLATAERLISEFTPGRLLDRSIGAVDPERNILRSVKSKAERHPVLTVAILAGLCSLLTEKKPPTGPPTESRKPRVTRAAKPRPTSKPLRKKEKDNGNDQPLIQY